VHANLNIIPCRSFCTIVGYWDIYQYGANKEKESTIKKLSKYHRIKFKKFVENFPYLDKGGEVDGEEFKEQHGSVAHPNPMTLSEFPV
jgi:hypothetical protein